jgi:hypothetical protein
MSEEDKLLETCNLLINDDEKVEIDTTPFKLIDNDENEKFEPTFKVFFI